MVLNTLTIFINKLTKCIDNFIFPFTRNHKITYKCAFGAYTSFLLHSALLQIKITK
jgi:hypothetical protein